MDDPTTGRTAASLDEEGFAAAIDGVPAPVVVFDGEGTIRALNAAVTDRLGY